MPSEYDALLEPPPNRSDYDALLSATAAAPSDDLTKYLVGPGFGEKPPPPAPNLAGQILENAATGLARTAEGFVPHSVYDAAKMLTPAAGAPEEIVKSGRALSDILFGGKGVEETERKYSPENFALADAEKTPAFSKERFTAGFGTLAQLLMAGGIVHGLPEIRPRLSETLFPEEKPAIATEIPPTPKEVTDNASQITSAAGLPREQVRPNLDEEASLRQPGQAAETRPETQKTPQEIAPAALSAVASAKAGTFRGPADAFGSEVTPVASYLIDNVGGLLSKSAAHKAGRFAGNEELWNGAQDALSHPTHNKIYNPSGEPPDAAAQALFDAGLIKEPTHDAMWDALRHESQTSRTVARQSRAEAQAADAAHAEWQDQLKAGERDPVVQLMTSDGQGAAVIVRGENGKGVELHTLGENGDTVASATHDTLDAALKSAHEQGLLLDEGGQSGRPIFSDEAARPASAGDSETPQQAQPAPPEIARLRSGENQGDLLANQTEDLKLVGEKGTDYSALQAAAEASDKAKAESDATQQTKLFDASDWTGATARVAERGRFQEFRGRYSSSAHDESLPSGGKETVSANLKPGDVIRAPSLSSGQIFEKTVAKVEAPVGTKLSAEQKITFTDGSEVHTVGDRRWTVYDRKSEQLRRQEASSSESAAPKAKASDLQDTEQAGPQPQTSVAEEPPNGGMRLSKTAAQAAAIPNPLASPIVAKALKAIELRKMSPLDAATTERSARLQQSFADAERAQKEIQKVAPTERRQAAISVYMEAAGDQQKLSQWAAAAKGKQFRQAAIDAQTLKPDELAIAQKARSAFDVLEKRGNTYDVLGSHRDNYVPHVWDVDKNFSGIGSSKLQDRFKFNKARTFENFFEGDQANFEPKTMAIGKLLPAYLHEMNKVIADRQFIQDLQAKGAKASDGSPLVIPRGRVSTIETDAGGKAYLANPDAYKNAKDAAGNPIDQSKYKVIDQPALTDWRWESKDENGNPIYMKDDLAVHPELAKRLNAVMGQSAIRQWYNEPSSGISTIPKAIAKGLDTAQSVMKREMFSLLAPFHQVQEGTHAIGHTVNPFGGLEDMSKPTPEHIDAMQHGLMLLPDKGSSSGYIEGLGGRGGFIAQAGRWLGEKAPENVIGKGANTIASTVDGYQNYLFHQYIPALKFKTYQHILERNMGRYADQLASGKVSEADVKLLSAEQSNAAYGHINYALLDRNPTMQHIMQLSLLAPDFLEARARFVGQAAKSLLGETAGHEQFRAIAVLAATQAATMFTLSQVLGGEYDWKRPFEMTVGNRRYLLRSVPEDLHRLLFQGPDVRREFVSARVNPTLQKVDQLRTGLNYRGEKTAALDTMGELLANYIPITARWIPGVRQLTQTSKNSPVSPLEQLAGALGVKISRYSAITQTHQLAAQWMDKQKLPRDTGVYPTSKFTPLRYALEDADLPRAEKEWKKLVADEGDDEKLSKGFKLSVNHPFTGNKARDEEFANSLKGKDRLMYDRALEVREGILDKFNLIH